MNRIPQIVALASVCAVAACAPAAPVADPVPAGPPPSYPRNAPELAPMPDLQLPSAVEHTLPNGMRVIYVSQPRLPVINALLLTRGGLSDDPAQLPGLAAFTADMLDEGAGGRGALELAEAVEFLGATLWTGAGWDAAQIGLQVLRPRFGEALRLMADVAYRPDFAEADVRRIREQRLTQLTRARDEARTIAANAFAAMAFGTEHPYGRLTTTRSVGSIDRRALADFHRRFYLPGSSTLLLVGDVDPAVHHALVEEAFAAWSGGAVAAPVAPPTPEDRAVRIIVVDRPNAPQSEVRIGHPAVARDHPDFYPLQVLNTILGGSFTSRLMQNLRETHGYTYGAGSGFQMRRGAGPFMASSAIVTAKTDSAMIEFFNELNRIRDDAVPADELQRAKQYIAGGLPMSFETTGGVAGRLAELIVYDLPLNTFDEYVQRIMAVTAADVQRVANAYVRPGQATVVVVGDRATVEPALRALQMGEVEVRGIEEFVH
jgi:zinc protease